MKPEMIYISRGLCADCDKKGYGTSQNQANKNIKYICSICGERRIKNGSNN